MSEPNTIKQVGFSSRKAGRPIRLDKGAIKRLAKYLSGRILKDLFKRPLDEPIIETGRYLINDYTTIQDVVGNDIKTLVLIKSERAAKRRGMIIGGGAGTTPGGEQQAIQINLNGSWTPAEFSQPPPSFGRQNLPKELYSILLHELTHIADTFKKSGPTTRRVLREDELDLEEYYNRPAEVKAYMQDVVNDVISNLPSVKEMYDIAKRDISFNKMIKQSLIISDTWERIEPYLSRQNKKKIMSAVYREAEDWREDTDYSWAASV